MNDFKIEQFSLKLNDMNISKFVIIFIDKLLDRFSQGEFFVSEKSLLAMNDKNEKISINIDTSNNILLKVLIENNLYEIEETEEKTEIVRSLFFNKYKKIETSKNKLASYNKLIFDKEGNIKYTDFWNCKMEKNNTKFEEITSYENEKAYRHFKYINMNYNYKEQNCFLLKNNGLNLNDYIEYLNSVSNLNYTLDILIKDLTEIEETIIKFISLEKFNEKIKKLKINKSL